ncbi:MAG: serine--tRNA ligase, partial [Rhodoplanes sp.]
MLDIRWIRENAEAFDAALNRRGMPPDSPRLLALDQRRRDALTAAQEIQARRNALSKEIGQRKARREDVSIILDEVARHKEEQTDLEARAAAADAELQAALAQVPNVPDEDVPDGPDESANVELRRWGHPPAFEFPAKEHFELGEALGMMDFERAGKLSGARFVVLPGGLARLERALA